MLTKKRSDQKIKHHQDVYTCPNHHLLGTRMSTI